MQVEPPSEAKTEEKQKEGERRGRNKLFTSLTKTLLFFVELVEFNLMMIVIVMTTMQKVITAKIILMLFEDH